MEQAAPRPRPVKLLRFIEKPLLPLLLLALPLFLVPSKLGQIDLVWQADLRAQSLAVNAVIIAIVAYGLTIVMRFAGLPSVVHGALWGTGAYTAGILVRDVGWNFWPVLPLAALVPALLALVVGVIALRTHGLAFLIMTIAMAEFLVLVGNNATDLTEGRFGFVVSAGPDDLGPFTFQSMENRYYMALAFLYITIALVWWISQSSFGRRLMAIRDNEDLARSLGINAFFYKIVAFAVSSAVVGVAGQFFLFHNKAIEPSLFGVFPFIIPWLMVIMGGLHSLAGPAIGAWMVQFLREWLQPINVGPIDLGDPNGQQFVFGLLLVIFMLVSPTGIVGTVKQLYSDVRDKALARWLPDYGPREAEAVGVGAPAATTSAPAATVAATAGLDPPPAMPITATANRSFVPPPLGAEILHISSLSKSFGAVRALDGVDVTVNGGEILGIIGPNGSGKTTLFNCVSGFFTPDQGRVIWRGRDITDWPADRVARYGLVRTFQQTMLFPMATVRASCQTAYESVHTFGRRDLVKLNLPGDVDGILEFCGLGDVANQPVAGLPYGITRKIGVAVALGTFPQLLMLDEPAAGLNEVEGEDLGELLLRVRQAGVTLVVVDHDMPFLMPICDRMVVLDAGRKIAEGTAAAIGTNEQVIAAYLGETFAQRAVDILKMGGA